MALIKGTSGADNLIGSVDNDTLQAGAGNDTLTGAAGDDLLQGGTGNNTYIYRAGDGHDTISSLLDTTPNKFSVLILDPSIYITDQNFQRVGNDLVLTISSEDSITIQGFFTTSYSPIQKIKSQLSGESWDLSRLMQVGNGLHLESPDAFADAKLVGGNYNDTINGGYGNDTLQGGAGNDLLNGSYGDDLLDGGAGNDQLFGDFGRDTLVGGAGDDTLQGGYESTLMQGGAGNDLIVEGSTQDTIDGGAGNDLIKTNGGASEILFGKGDGKDIITGQGNGALRFKTGVSVADIRTHRVQDDLLIEVGTSDGVTIKDFFKTDADGTHNGPVQQVLFTDNTTTWDADALVARIAANTKTVNGTSANDTLKGGATDDLINGGAGNDSLVGGAGFDTLVGGAGVDSLVGGTGDDTYVIDSTSDVITELANEGNDTVVLSGLTYSLNTTKLANVENIKASTNSAASYTGNALANNIEVSGSGATKLLGLAGDDTLRGGSGNDTLDGGTGNNTYVFGNGSGQDQIVSSTDTSTTKFNAVRFGPDVNYSDITFRKVGNNLQVSLANAADTLTVQNFFLGNTPGNINNPVQVFYLAGWDVPAFTAQQVQDIILQGDDTITGTTANDLLLGGAGNDALAGLLGNDTLDGGLGDDVLNGGTGNNTYLYGKGDGRDVIEAVKDTNTSRLNTLKFKPGIDVNDVKLRHKGDDLVVSLSATDRVTVKGFFANGGPTNNTNPVQQLVFADGNLTLTAAQVAKMALTANPAIVGTSGDDILAGDYDDDHIYGAEGNDLIDGRGGNDTLEGGQGDDILRAGTSLIGGEGDDRYMISNTDVVAITELADQGTDTIDVILSDSGSGYASYSLNTPELANVENLTAQIGSSQFQPDVILTGNAANNFIDMAGLSYSHSTLYGLDGNDTLTNTSRGSADLVGGNGNDTYFVGNQSTKVIEEAGGGIDTIHCSSGAYDGQAIAQNVENVEFDFADQTIIGNQEDNHITAQYSYGAVFDGKEGADTYELNGGSGTFIFDSIDDRAIANGGTGKILSSVSVTLSRNIGVHDVQLTGHGGNQITGTSEADTLTGNDAQNLIMAGGGDDQIDGGAGNDQLIGGAGNNTYLFGQGSGSDAISSGSTVDASDVNRLVFKAGVSASQVHWVRTGSFLQVSIDGGDSVTIRDFFDSNGDINPLGPIQQFKYTDSGFVLTADEFIAGGTGSIPPIVGTNGNDTLNGTDSPDLILGLDGSDMLNGGLGNDTLDGGAGSDLISDVQGDNTFLFGIGDGNDFIAPNSGASGSYHNTLAFKAGVKPSDLTFTIATQSPRDLTISINAQDSVVLGDFFDVDGGPKPVGVNGVERVIFRGTGETWTIEELARRALPTGVVLSGTTGDDTLTANVWQQDTLIGGQGNDTYVAGHFTTIKEEANQGTDTVVINGSYSLDTPDLANIEILTGTAGESKNGTWTGNAQDNIFRPGGDYTSLNLIGGEGNDTFQGTRLGGQNMFGGKGNDTYYVSYRDDSSTITELADEGIDTVVMDYAPNSRFFLDTPNGANVENLIVNSNVMGGITVNGNATNNNITIGYAGGITIDGKEGADTVTVNGGSATFIFDNVGDRAIMGTNLSPHGRIQSSVSVDLNQQVNIYEATLTGNANANLNGTDSADLLTGNAGANLLTGGAGNDTLDGGAGNDMLRGEAGSNTYLFGLGDGRDDISAATSTSSGDVNTLTMKSGIQAGMISGARDGNDLVLRVSNTDSITIKQFFTSTGEVNSGCPVQQLTFTDSADVWGTDKLAALVPAASPGNLVSGTSGNDTLVGTAGSDYISGLAGDDSLTSGVAGGQDTMDGGMGNDTIHPDSQSSTIVAYGLGDGMDTLYPGSSLRFKAGVNESMVSVSKVNGDILIKLSNTDQILVKYAYYYGPRIQSGLHSISFTDSNTVWDSNKIDDLARPWVTTTGTNGADTLRAIVDSRNILVGGQGNDTYYINSTLDDKIVENPNEGIDTLITTGGATLNTSEYANIENLYGGSSNTSYGSSTQLTGNSLDNYISGSSPNGYSVTIYGEDGNDTMFGSSWYVTLVGGKGNDTYVVGGERELYITENADEGIDTLKYYDAYALYPKVDLAYTPNIENVDGRDTRSLNEYYGTDLDNTFWGNAWTKTFDGRGGADTYHAQGNNNANYYFDNAGDKIIWDGAPISGDGSQIFSSVNVDLHVQPYVHKLTLTGQDALIGLGSDVDDQLTGNAAGNRLAGAKGNDTLNGGIGGDTYSFAAGDGSDVIADTGGTDELKFTGMDSTQLVFSQVGMDLKVSSTSSADSVLVSNWFASTDNQLETITAANGFITNAQVNNLVQAMSAAAAAGGSGTSATPVNQQPYWTLPTPVAP